MSRIYLRLQEIGGNSEAIKLSKKPIATFLLWATRIEIFGRFDLHSDITRHQFFELWDRIHLTNPAPARIYLKALFSYLDVDQNRVTVCRGSEHGARAASLCLLRALSGLDQKSTALQDVRQRYLKVIPPDANFGALLCYHAINAIHAVLMGRRKGWSFSWTDYHPCIQEHVFFANALVKIAQKGGGHGKVPRWILRFAIHSLSKHPPSPTSVVIDCLTIIAIDLGSDTPDDDGRNLDERYACPAQLRTLSH